MGNLKSIELIEFCKSTFENVTIIGVVYPSVIVEFNNKRYVIYRAQGQEQGKYVLVSGLDRIYFESPSILKKLIK